ncbi:MAG: Crp/Fnr family transcriptional regulator, partial [Alphaproteobacteria bacterium]
SGISCRQYKKGEILFFKGDLVSGFHIVAYGQIKLIVQSEEGEEKVVEIIGHLQSFGEAMMFLDRPYPVTAQALADSLILDVARGPIDALLAEDATCAQRMLAGLSIRLHSLIQDVEAYSLGSSAQRVIGYLLQHCPDPDNKAPVRIVLPTSKQVIASRLNLVPETLSRILTELTRSDMIEVQGRTILIKAVARLRAHTGDAGR